MTNNSEAPFYSTRASLEDIPPPPAPEEISLQPPQETPSDDIPNREQWIEQVCSDFVQPSTANRQYYRVVLETLWPEGHGIPGPHVSESEIRQAIDDSRQSGKPYRDPFRRVRELQGEEAVYGIAKQGRTYQIVHLDIGLKRAPRTALSDAAWGSVLERYDHRCAVCRRQDSDVHLEQDHKIPRTRPDSMLRRNPHADREAWRRLDDEENWQPLCTECNNFKSVACRGCRLDCNECPYAFPETHTPVKVSSRNIGRLRERANALGCSIDELANQILESHLNG